MVPFSVPVGNPAVSNCSGTPDLGLAQLLRWGTLLDCMLRRAVLLRFTRPERALRGVALPSDREGDECDRPDDHRKGNSDQ